MTTDPWLAAPAVSAEQVVAVRKYLIVEIADPENSPFVATLESSDGSQFAVRFPKSLQPFVDLWVWCLQTNSQLWPFATDEQEI